MIKFTTFVLILSSTIFSQLSEIKLSCDFENGYIPVWRTMSYQSKEFYSYGDNPTFFSSTKPRIEYKGLYLTSDFTFFWAYEKGSTGTPFRTMFETEVGYTYKFITLKIAQGCNHSIVTIPDDLNSNPTLYDVAHLKVSLLAKIHN